MYPPFTENKAYTKLGQQQKDMAEIISLIGAVAGLLDVALRSCTALHQLQSQLRNAPALVHALSNEIQDLRVVLTLVRDTLKASDAIDTDPNQNSAVIAALRAQLQAANAILGDLNLITEKLAAEKPTMRRIKWCLTKSRASELQGRLRDVRMKINELLLAHIRRLYLNWSTGTQVLTYINLHRSMMGIFRPLRILPWAVPQGRRIHRRQQFSFWIVDVGSINAVRHILQSNRESVLDVYHRDGRSALMMALGGFIWSPRTVAMDIVKALLSVGADPDLEDDNGTSARSQAARLVLSRAAPREFCAELEKLLPLSESLDDLGLTLVHKVVVGYCHMDLASILESGGPEIRAQVNARDSAGYTPIMYAIQRGDLHKVEVLIKAGADVDAANSNGNTPLQFAVKANVPAWRCLELVDFLLEAGADVNKADARLGFSVIHTATQNNYAALIRRLLSAGAGADIQSLNHGSPPMFYAARHNSCEVIQALYEAGADINAAERDGRTPLSRAVESNAHEALALLLRLDASHLRVNKAGRTLLHTAAEVGDENTLKLLADFDLHGLDWRSENTNGMTALDVFERRPQASHGLFMVFRPLLRSLDSFFHPTEEAVSDNASNSDDDEFVDAPEFTSNNDE
ncbi:ankyrin repeat-containing domain protein [Podospora australis]|uniref:Ankyrin repeat-containing domain protein n=1 Tax=Podospora australis TaxID=1536484 RepID=A0AAN7AD33_9PEZI|nr:ankyrin repeat-containing domain protein [Podospora australis]